MSIRLIVLLAELSLEGVTPNNDLFGEAPPKGVPFFRLQVHEKVEISSIRKSRETCDFGL